MSPQAISTLTCGLALAASHAAYGLASNGQFQSSRALTQKRLGDAFYEQQLVQQQLSAFTSAYQVNQRTAKPNKTNF